MNDPRESQRFYLRETATRRLTVALARLLLFPIVSLRVTGVEHLPHAGACVMIANHLGNLDVFPLQFALPRPIFFMAKAELFTHPALGWFLRKLGAFPVQRGSRDQWAMEHARRILDQGLMLGMFPEGTRSHGRGLGVAKTGAARLALETRAPLLPVGIVGGGKVPRGPVRRSMLTIVISEPLFPRIDDDPLSLTERAMFALAASLPPEARGVYAEPPPRFIR